MRCICRLAQNGTPIDNYQPGGLGIPHGPECQLCSISDTAGYTSARGTLQTPSPLSPLHGRVSICSREDSAKEALIIVSAQRMHQPFLSF